jgi:hypothetical protein
VSGSFEENVRAYRFHVDGMVRLYNKIANQLAKFYVQVITSDPLGIGFGLGLRALGSTDFVIA